MKAMHRINNDDLRCVTHENQLRELVQEPLFSYLKISSVSTERKKELLTVIPGKAFCLLCTDDNLSNAFPEAFILPVQWTQSNSDSDRLPRSFRDQAANIRSITGHNDWMLTLSDELREYDLSDVAFETDSIGVSLAAALEIAATGVQPKSGIFATGELKLKEKYIAAVGHIAAKVRLVESMTLPGKTSMLYVPLDNLEEAKNAIKHKRRVMVLPYSDSVSGWRTAMADHLRNLHLPPQEKAPRNEKIEYINRDYIQNNSTLWRKFYLENLVSDLAYQLRKDKILHQPPPARMISAVSFSYELAVLVMNVFKPEEIRFLITPEISDNQHIKNTLMNYKPKNTTIHYMNVKQNEYKEAIVTEMIHWLMEVPEGARAVEATSGTKLITLSLATIAEATGAALYYFPHTLRNKSPMISDTDRFIVVPGIANRFRQCKNSVPGTKDVP